MVQKTLNTTADIEWSPQDIVQNENLTRRTKYFLLILRKRINTDLSFKFHIEFKQPL